MHCSDGRCHVDSCLPGYTPSAAADVCIEIVIHLGHPERSNRLARSYARSAAAAAAANEVNAVVAAAANVEVGDIVEVAAKGGVVVDV